MSKIPKAVAAKMQAESQPAVSEDKLDHIRDKCQEARALELERAELETQLSQIKTRHYKLTTDDIPSMMNDVGLRKLSIEKRGNFPAIDVEVKPNYKASISAEWEQERQDKAFEYLDERGSGDIIKNTFTVYFDRDAATEAKAFEKMLDDGGYIFENKRSVPWATLTSWLKAEVESLGKSGRPYPNLELIGGIVGKIVKLKERSDD